jgi:hypothetical protein
VYGWAYQRLYHHRADRAVWCIFNTSTVTLETYETVPSADAFRVFEQTAEMVWKAISEGRYDGCGTCSLCNPRVVKDFKGPAIAWEGAR